MSRSKGNRIVRERGIPFYENLGFLVDKTEHVDRYSKSQDLYSTALGEDYSDTGFDLIAIKQNHVILVQVKTNSPPTQKWYRAFAEIYAGTHLHIHCFTWYDRDGIRIQHYTPDGSIVETDLRKSKNGTARVIWWEQPTEIFELPDIQL